MLTNNRQQFTERFSRGGEVLYDEILAAQRDHATAYGAALADHDRKIERFHQTLRRERLDHAGSFVSLLAAQGALDDWSAATRRSATPIARNGPARHADERFQPAPSGQRELPLVALL